MFDRYQRTLLLVGCSCALVSTPALAVRGSCTRVKRAELLSAENTLLGVLNVIALRAGVTFNTVGDPGSEDWVLLRGLPRDSSRNVLLLLDGMPLNNAFSEGWDLGDAPADMMSHVEICKPPLSAQYGGYHAVINVVTVKSVAVGQLSASVALGNHDSQQLDVNGAYARRGFSVLGNVGLQRSAGLSGLRRTPPYQDFVREDRSYFQTSPFITLQYRLSERATIGAWGQFIDAQKQFSDEEFRTRRSYRVNAFFASDIGDLGDVRVNAYGAFEDYFLRLRMHSDVRGQDRLRLGGRVVTRWRLPLGNVVRAGGDVGRAQLSLPDGATTSLSIWSLWLEDSFTPWRWLTLYAGLRYDGSKVGHAANPSAGLTLRPWAGATLTGGWSVSTRWPSLSELPPPGGVSVRGERLDGVNVSAMQQLFDRLRLSAAFFYLRLHDELVSGAAGWVNAEGALRSLGIEAEVSLRLLRGFEIFANYTYNVVDHVTDGERVPYGPSPHLASGGLFFHRGPLTARVSARYLGKKRGIFRMGGQPSEVTDVLLVDAYAAHSVVRWLRVSITGSNLTNRRYETFQGSPMLGRTVIGELEIIYR